MVTTGNTFTESHNQRSSLLVEEPLMEYQEFDDPSILPSYEESDYSSKSNACPNSSSQYMEFTAQNISVTLCDSTLWTLFNNVTNEMIVTRDGRRMFPVIKVCIQGLDPSEMYKIQLDFKLIDNHRWKYINGEWMKGTHADLPLLSRLYTHPDSPNYGKFFMESFVAFSRIKITNKDDNDINKIFLNSMYKYIPRIHILKISNDKQIDCRMGTFSFPETEFVAVTAYQNDSVTSLKVKYNPFAKAFLEPRDNGDSSYCFRDNQVSRTCTFINNMYNPVNATLMKSIKGRERIGLENSKLYSSTPDTFDHNTSIGVGAGIGINCASSMELSTINNDEQQMNTPINGINHNWIPRISPYYNSYIHSYIPLLNSYNKGNANRQFNPYFLPPQPPPPPLPSYPEIHSYGNGIQNNNNWTTMDAYSHAKVEHVSSKGQINPNIFYHEDKKNNKSYSLKFLADIAAEQLSPSNKIINKSTTSNMKKSEDFRHVD